MDVPLLCIGTHLSNGQADAMKGDPAAFKLLKR